jgi:hypothetical protein
MCYLLIVGSLRSIGIQHRLFALAIVSSHACFSGRVSIATVKIFVFGAQIR